MSEAAKAPFPRTFYYANAIELLERLAFYGMYIGLSLYLSKVVGFSDIAGGALLGNFRLVSSLAPVVCGSVADKIGFKPALVCAFVLYVIGYFLLFAVPTKTLAVISLLFIAIGGAFLKPVITGTVVRTAPEGRENDGFAIFYRMVNSGSVVGKTLAFIVRRTLAVRFVMVNSVIASALALVLVFFGYKEPERGKAKETSLAHTLKGYGEALKNVRFTVFLVIFAGYYFMIEQFYMTFPKYVTRHIDAKAPLEIITLINPAAIALLQGFVTRGMRKVHPLTTMVLGVFIASISMFVMGTIPTLVGACLSGFIFAIAEMTFSPRFYAYIASFAPEGRAGLYMGLAFIPPALGSWIGGQVSGRLIARYLPEVGDRSPFIVWSTYAACGVLCAALMLVYRYVTLRHEAKALSEGTPS